jgi:glycosyltransferase involved in cell wall biosynthesis
MIRNLWQQYKRLKTKRLVNKLNNDASDSFPYFSVVIPVYDRTVELREAIDSILSQTFVNFELLLVCDGSPSETVEVVTSYLENPKIRAFFFDDNIGTPCRGRNKGIEMARGRFIAFLDSDDIAMPNRLEITLFHLLTKNVDVVGGAIQYMTDGERCREFRNGQIGFTSEKCTYDMLLQGNRLSICTVTVRKNCLEKYGAFREEMRYREDHELWLRLAFHGCSFYNSPEIYAKYRVHDNNAELLYLADDHKWLQKALDLHVHKLPTQSPTA